MSMSTRTPVFKDHPIAALAFICLSVFVISVDATIVNVALPTLSRELDADTAQLQWIVDAYTLVLAGLLLAAGSLSDRFGRRGWLSAGLVAVRITSAVAAQSDSADALICGARCDGRRRRADLPGHAGDHHQHLHRPGAAGQGDRHLGSHGRASAWPPGRSPVAGCSSTSGGVRSSSSTCRSPSVAIVGGSLFVPTSRDPRHRRVDVLGLILSVDRHHRARVHDHRGARVGLDVGAHARAGSRWPPSCSPSSRCGSGASPHPMLDVSLFRNLRFSAGSVAITAAFFALFGFIFLITQYFQLVRGYGPLEAGVRMLPVAFSIAVASIVGAAHRRADRHHGRGRRPGWPSSPAGLALGVHASAPTRPYPVIVAQMVLLGGGLGLTTAPATESIMGSLSADKAGVGSAVNDTTRELGGTLGVAIVGSVFASIYSGRLGSNSVIAALPADLRSTIEDSMAAAEQVVGQLPTNLAAGVRDAVQHCLPRRSVHRIAGLRRYRISCGCRRRRPTSRPRTSINHCCKRNRAVQI